VRAQKSAVRSSVAAYISEKQKSHTATEVVSARKRMLIRDPRSRMPTTAPRRKTSVAVASGSAAKARKA
jgi:hypothetical protein